MDPVALITKTGGFAYDQDRHHVALNRRKCCTPEAFVCPEGVNRIVALRFHNIGTIGTDIYYTNFS